MIKFRVFIKELNRIFEVQNLVLEEGQQCVWVEQEGLLKQYRFDEVILEQYTGLKDADGKELYAGDIFSNMRNYYQVVFDDKIGAFIGINVDDSREYELVSDLGVDKIIGNIHENPDLLEQE